MALGDRKFSTEQVLSELASEDSGLSKNLRIINAACLVPYEHDYIALSWTGTNLTTVEYFIGGAGGTKVATLTLAYTGSQLDSVTKT